MSAAKSGDVLEDLTWLDSTGVGAIEAAERTGFPSPEALEKWLHRAEEYPLWLRLKARDPKGIHNERRTKPMSETQPADAIAALIARAQQSSRKRTRTKADRISDLIADVRQALDTEEHEDKAREVARKDVERLERQLREARAILKGGTSTPDGPSDSAIREWAKAEGIECSAQGRVAGAVRAAFLAREAS